MQWLFETLIIFQMTKINYNTEIEKFVAIYRKAFIDSYEHTVMKYFSKERGNAHGIGSSIFPDLLNADVFALSYKWRGNPSLCFVVYLSNEKICVPKVHFVEIARDFPQSLFMQKTESEIAGILNDSQLIDIYRTPASTIEHEDTFRRNADVKGNNYANSEYVKYLRTLPKSAHPSVPKIAPQLESLGQKFRLFLDSTDSNQNKGKEFEALIVNLLNLYGWNAKNVNLGFEENDISAMYGTQHILGEVKYENKKVGVPHIRNFLSKLDPRPNTIGIFFSYSGFSLKTINRPLLHASYTKTVILFDGNEIDALFDGREDLNDLFQKKLRERYELIFKGAEL